MMHARFRSLLDVIGQGLDAGTLPFSEAASWVSEHVCQSLRCARVSVWVWSDAAAPVDPGAPRVLHRAGGHALATGRDAPGVTALPHVVDEADYPEYFDALRAEAMFESADTLEDPRLARLRGTALAPEGMRAMLDALIGFNGQPTGVFRCEHDAPRAWTPEERLYLKRFALELSLRRARRAVREARVTRAQVD